MNEFTKSMLSFPWAMSLFGVKQVVNILTPESSSQPAQEATQAFNTVTQATEEQLSNILESTFKAGDQMQRGMVDMMFSFLTFEAFFNPMKVISIAANTMQSTIEALSERPSKAQPAEPEEKPSPAPSEEAGWVAIPPPGTLPRLSVEPIGWGPGPADSSAPVRKVEKPVTPAAGWVPIPPAGTAPRLSIDPLGWGPVPGDSSAQAIEGEKPATAEEETGEPEVHEPKVTELGDVEQKILEALRAEGQLLLPREVANRTGEPVDTVRESLRALVADGRVQRRDSRYELPE